MSFKVKEDPQQLGVLQRRWRTRRKLGEPKATWAWPPRRRLCELQTLRPGMDTLDYLPSSRIFPVMSKRRPQSMPRESFWPLCGPCTATSPTARPWSGLPAARKPAEPQRRCMASASAPRSAGPSRCVSPGWYAHGGGSGGKMDLSRLCSAVSAGVGVVLPLPGRARERLAVWAREEGRWRCERVSPACPGARLHRGAEFGGSGGNITPCSDLAAWQLWLQRGSGWASPHSRRH